MKHIFRPEITSVIIWQHNINNSNGSTMNENNESIGEVLKKISGGDLRRQIRYDEESGDFIIETAETPMEEGTQDATRFAGEGYA